MKLQVEDNKIVGFVTIGSNDGDVNDIDIDESILPDDFIANWDSGKYLYIGGAISLNPDYVVPTAPVIPPSDQDEIIATLTKDVADLKQQLQVSETTNAQLILQNAELKKMITTQPEGGTANVQ